MINTPIEHERAREELEHVRKWLDRLNKSPDEARDELSRASVQRLLERIECEISDYENTHEPEILKATVERE